jgi:putative tributyrin esterase
MAFFDCHFYSETLSLDVAAHVLLPDAGAGRVPFPTLWLLHGLSDDHTAWMRGSSIERYAAERGIAVVMPAAGRSFYQDMASGPRYWTFLSQELPSAMRRFFPLSPARVDNFAAGLSMGGYGALRLGLACPEKFAAAASLSGALDYTGRLRRVGKRGSSISVEEWRGIAGAALRPSPERDLFELASRISRKRTRPALWLDCGTEDDIILDSREFHAHLDKIGYSHHFEEGPGRHDWAYWDSQIKRVLEWLPFKK